MRQRNAIFPPRIHQTWPEPFSGSLCFTFVIMRLRTPQKHVYDVFASLQEIFIRVIRFAAVFRDRGVSFSDEIPNRGFPDAHAPPIGKAAKANSGGLSPVTGEQCHAASYLVFVSNISEQTKVDNWNSHTHSARWTRRRPCCSCFPF